MNPGFGRAAEADEFVLAILSEIRIRANLVKIASYRIADGIVKLTI